jgi:hypothetical protein
VRAVTLTSGFINPANWLPGFNVSRLAHPDHQDALRPRAHAGHHPCAQRCPRFAMLAGNNIIQFDVNDEPARDFKETGKKGERRCQFMS